MNETLAFLGEELTAKYEALMEGADGETGEVDLDKLFALDAAQDAFEEKAAKTGRVIRFLHANAETLREEKRRISELLARYEKREESLKVYLSACLCAAGIKKVDKFPSLSVIGFRSAESVVIDDGNALPEAYVAIERKPLKEAIRAALRDGDTVSGAHLERSYNIQIK